MIRLHLGALTVLILAAGSTVRGQDADDVKRLKERIELLETKLKLAEKENELLRKENELLKAKQPSVGKDGAKKSLSDLLPEGKVLLGNSRSSNTGKMGEITLTMGERDGTKFKGNMILKYMGETTTTDLEGTITGTQFSFKSVGSATKLTVSLTLKGDGLEGTYSVTSGGAGGGKGTIGLKLPK